MKAELEMMFEIWPGDESELFHYEVGPDRDGLGSIEIRYLETNEHNKSEVKDRMAFTLEAAELLKVALEKLIEEGKKRQKSA